MSGSHCSRVAGFLSFFSLMESKRVCNLWIYPEAPGGTSDSATWTTPSPALFSSSGSRLLHFLPSPALMKRVKRGEEERRTRVAGGVTSARKSKQAYLLSCSRPLNKQAGYHITNIYLTPPQKVWRGLCVGEGAVPKPFWPTRYQVLLICLTLVWRHINSFVFP